MNWLKQEIQQMVHQITRVFHPFQNFEVTCTQDAFFFAHGSKQ